MTTKVRQGLGLLVVAFMGWLVTLFLQELSPRPFALVATICAIATLVCGAVGLVFLAVGLLKPQRG